MSVLDNADISAPATPGAAAGAEALARRATHVAARLAEVANPHRLVILCKLAEAEGGRPPSVGELQAVVGLSQSALSQHLARLRAAGMVVARREGQTVRYSLADDETRLLMRALYAAFCAEV